MLESLRLPLSFDPLALRQDLDQVPADSWIRHFNTGYYEGEWSGVALRGPATITHPIQALFANPDTQQWADTTLLTQSPYFTAVLAHFQCPLQSVRLLRLAPGSRIREHRDHALGFEDGEVRLHIPILSNPQVGFFLNGRRLSMGVGETWYVNVNLPHRVANNGADYRVHLVIDCAVNDWLKNLFLA
jgi:hypothetical protein